MHVGAVEPFGVVSGLLELGRLQTDQGAKHRRVLDGEIEHDAPPIEQPITTGRSSSSARQNATIISV